MNTFVDSIQEQVSRTENGMKARQTSANAVVDFFYNVGASRGKDIIPQFVAALAEDKELALRVALWARDVRGGAGERELFRSMLTYLENTDSAAAELLMNKIPELGRFDDLFVFNTSEMKAKAYTLLGQYLSEKNGLAAKWTPRKGKIAAEIRDFFGMSPKQYRKSLVALTNVVESQMCPNDWDNINFSHVPSKASSIYKRAFNRHTPKFAEYVEKLTKGDPSVKVNANAIFPHDVIKSVLVETNGYWPKLSETEINHVIAQWNALPNYVGNSSILPLVDVSGSMARPAGNDTSVRCLDVAVSLGLYLADKNTGPFNGAFMTFSSSPQLVKLNGNIVQKVHQMVKSRWEMSTNLHAALEKILNTATTQAARQEDMPKMLLIFSDMQFNACVRYDDSAMEMIERKYAEAGYEVPAIVFWNLNSKGNTPVKADKSGAALVSGFSPSILTSLLSADPKEFTPRGIMMKTIMNTRYDF